MTAPPVHPVDLEPSLVGDRTYVSRRRSLRIDVALIFSIMIGFLYLIPSRLILPGMTDLGRPALVIGLLMWCWWVLSRLNPRLLLVGPNPIRWALLAYTVSMIISYAAGFLRGLSSMEANAADRAILSMAVFTGVALMAADGMPNWERLTAVLRTLLWCAAFMAVIGIIQFAFKIDLAAMMNIPGLQSKGWVPEPLARGSDLRVASTTTHYIEFSCCMALTLPFGIHLARFSPTKKMRRTFTILTMLVAAGLPATISRTGFIAAFLGILVLLPVWNWRMRYNVAALAACGVVGLFGVKPGLVRTMYEMFAGVGEDQSILVRVERYQMVYHYFVQRPWFGRGTGTWVDPQYQILDNQWLTTVLNNGLVGVGVVVTLHVTAIVLAGLAIRRAATVQDRHLCAALLSTQLMALAVAATFDSMSFSTYTTTLALMVGLCGAVWRFTHPARTIRTSTVSRLAS